MTITRDRRCGKRVVDVAVMVVVVVIVVVWWWEGTAKDVGVKV
jgi:hypothetical protein